MGFKTAMKVLDKGRLHIAASASAWPSACSTTRCATRCERKQFGQPIAEFQLDPGDAGRQPGRDLCRALHGARRRAPARRRARTSSTEASCCKLFASEMCGRVADRAVQIHGGAGYVADYGIERFYRDVRLFRIYEGTSQIQQIVIARNMIQIAEGPADPVRRSSMADLLVERPRDGVALVRINRPEAKERAERPRPDAAGQCLHRIGPDDGVRAIVLTGDTDVFAAGADIREWPSRAVEFLLARPTAGAADRRCPKPVIAAVNGYALGGGCELAMHATSLSPARAPGSASRRSASASCRRRRHPAADPRGRQVQGHADAADRRAGGAREADAMGLVSTVVPDAEALGRRPGLAETIAGMPPLAARRSRKSSWPAWTPPLDDGPELRAQGLPTALRIRATRRRACAPSWRSGARPTRESDGPSRISRSGHREQAALTAAPCGPCLHTRKR